MFVKTLFNSFSSEDAHPSLVLNDVIDLKLHTPFHSIPLDYSSFLHLHTYQRREKFHLHSFDGFSCIGHVFTREIVGYCISFDINYLNFSGI